MTAHWRWLSPTIFTLACFALWEIAARASGVSSILVPLPSDVLAVSVADRLIYLRNSVPTLIEVLGGFLAAIVFGSFCGLIIAFSRVLGRAVYPVLIASQIMPKVAITPLLVVWFGFGYQPKIIMTALIAFFPIVINTVIGFNMTTRQSIYLFRAMGASPLQTFLKLRVPTALPIYFGGLKVAATLAVIGVVVAEFYSSNSGLGYLLLLQASQSQTADAFGAIFYLTILGMGVFGIVALLERLLVPSHMLKRYDDATG